MYLAYYYPFSSPEMVQENTGFEIDVTRAELMEGPDPEIIRLIREEIDPARHSSRFRRKINKQQ